MTSCCSPRAAQTKLTARPADFTRLIARPADPFVVTKQRGYRTYSLVQLSPCAESSNDGLGPVLRTGSPLGNEHGLSS